MDFALLIPDADNPSIIFEQQIVSLLRFYYYDGALCRLLPSADGKPTFYPRHIQHIHISHYNLGVVQLLAALRQLHRNAEHLHHHDSMRYSALSRVVSELSSKRRLVQQVIRLRRQELYRPDTLVLHISAVYVLQAQQQKHTKSHLDK